MGFEIAEAALDRCPRVEIIARARPEHDAERLLGRTREFERVVLDRPDHRAAR